MPDVFGYSAAMPQILKKILWIFAFGRVLRRANLIGNLPLERVVPVGILNALQWQVDIWAKPLIFIAVVRI